MEGLTYDTKSQAETTAEALRTAGEDAIIVPIAGGKWRVYKTGREKAATEELAEAIEKEKLGEQKWEEFLSEYELEEEEAAYREAKERPKKVATKRAKLLLEAKKGMLERENKSRIEHGLDPKEIVPIRDPETAGVIDYELRAKQPLQTARDIGKEYLEVGSPEQLATIRKIGGLKGRLKQQAVHTTQKMPMPKATIAWLPQKPEDEGTIGVGRPAIGRIGQPGMAEANALGVKAKGFGAPPSEPLLKTTPRAKRITANGLKDIGFARIPRLERRKPEEEIEEKI